MGNSTEGKGIALPGSSSFKFVQLYYCGRPGTRFLTATASTITLTPIRPSPLLPGRSRVSAARASLPPLAAQAGSHGDSPADCVALVNAADSEPGCVRPGPAGQPARLRLTAGWAPCHWQ
jgi:hypothetical protein